MPLYKRLHRHGKAFISRGEVCRSRLSGRPRAALGSLAVQGLPYMRKIVLAAAATIGALALSACSEQAAEENAADAEMMAEDAAGDAMAAADEAGEFHQEDARLAQ